jgi:peptidoglycan hydrolase-like protein with peptidoglycan-binding domain
VHNLQVHLAGLGYLDAKGIDDIFGIRTRHAVERFQHDNHLAMDGKVGPLTQQALHAALQQQSAIRALSDRQNPDHALFAQALAGVRTLNAYGHPTEQQQHNLAAALVVEAKHGGLTRIDQVALGDNGNRVYIAQHPTSPMEQAKFGSVDTAMALQTPMAQSTAVAAGLRVSDQVPLAFPESHQSSRNSLAI